MSVEIVDEVQDLEREDGHIQPRVLIIRYSYQQTPDANTIIILMYRIDAKSVARFLIQHMNILQFSRLWTERRGMAGN
jgi:hypothetical protein